jgi:hypothetical protein
MGGVSRVIEGGTGGRKGVGYLGHACQNSNDPEGKKRDLPGMITIRANPEKTFLLKMSLPSYPVLAAAAANNFYLNTHTQNPRGLIPYCFGVRPIR